MKDFIGNELNVGDYVAFARNPYSDMILGKVIGYTPKGIKVIRKKKDNTWRNEYEVVFSYQCVMIAYQEGKYV